MAASMMAGVKHVANLGVASMEGAYGVAVVKGTNLDIVAPKEKHVRYLIQWTNENCGDDDLSNVFRCLAQRLEEMVTAPSPLCPSWSRCHHCVSNALEGWTRLVLPEPRLPSRTNAAALAFPGRRHRAENPGGAASSSPGGTTRLHGSRAHSRRYNLPSVARRVDGNLTLHPSPPSC